VNVHVLQETPPPALAAALEAFERQFEYPLGTSSTFHIAHGADYVRFFRAIGEAACFVVEKRGILGVLSAAVCQLQAPDGSVVPAGYLCDLKLAPAARRSLAICRLAQTAEPWLRARCDRAFGVVMDGTPAIPTRYTGALGIPAFREVAKIMVFRVPVRREDREGCGTATEISPPEAAVVAQRLGAGRFLTRGGAPAVRSEMVPLGLVLPGGGACGVLEDTRRAKRLLTPDGTELLSAHLSYFAYTSAADGAVLLRDALARCGRLGFPALFVAVPERDAEGLRRALNRDDPVPAPATVYGHGLPAGADWNINTAEI
jgi:hypothetical protein